MTASAAAGSWAGPFAAQDGDAYALWRDAKLAASPTCLASLRVEVKDLTRPTPAERMAIFERCRRFNMAVVSAPPLTGAVATRLRRFGAALGLRRIDRNELAGDAGISALMVAGESRHGDYIPYTDRALGWHTDGYYNPIAMPVRGLILHCAQDAIEGGENDLFDPDLAYIALRERDPVLVAALSRPDAMIIPANADPRLPPRPARIGPVFSIDPATGALHMRYTARTRSIVWHRAPEVAAARSCLTDLLADAVPGRLRLRLAPGETLVCNNVLHNRSAFRDFDGRRRLVYRVRYLDRVGPP